jgi:hypothetical protein
VLIFGGKIKKPFLTKWTCSKWKHFNINKIHFIANVQESEQKCCWKISEIKQHFSECWKKYLGIRLRWKDSEMLHKLARMCAKMGDYQQHWSGVGDKNCQ